MTEQKDLKINEAEGNKLIAKFMGLKPNPSDGGRTWGYEVIEMNGETYSPEWTTLKYHKSWDWLMPVVDKIEDMGYYFTICRWTCSVSEEWKDETKHGISTDSKINAVYKSVITFVNWYSRWRG